MICLYGFDLWHHPITSAVQGYFNIGHLSAWLTRLIGRGTSCSGWLMVCRYVPSNFSLPYSEGREMGCNHASQLYWVTSYLSLCSCSSSHAVFWGIVAINLLAGSACGRNDHTLCSTALDFKIFSAEIYAVKHILSVQKRACPVSSLSVSTYSSMSSSLSYIV